MTITTILIAIAIFTISSLICGIKIGFALSLMFLAGVCFAEAFSTREREDTNDWVINFLA